MNDSETTLLSDRLDRLADSMTPQVDVVGLVRTSRERNRRQRRGRVALLAVAAATAATAVAVPLGVGALTSSAPGDGVAGPGDSTPPADPRWADDVEDQLHTDHAEASRRLQEAGATRLAAQVAELAAAFEARGTPLSLTAPADLSGCPADTGAVSTAAGIRLHYRDSGLPGDMGECEWSTGSSGILADHLSVGIGFTPSWTERDVREGVLVDEGCERTELPGSTPTAVLDACPLADLDQWMLYVPDSSGTGVWTFGLAVGTNQPVDGAAVLAAVLEVADTTW